MSTSDGDSFRADMTEGHLRRIAATLTLLDRATCEFEQWTAGRQARSVLYEETNSLAPDQRKEIRQQVAAMRALLEPLKSALRLQHSRQDAAIAIRVRCGILWESLVELEPRRLRRYGPLPADATERINVCVLELLNRVEAIARCVSQPHVEP